LIVQADRAPTEQIRVGFTTTRKLGKAVVRNRIRRRLRALAREVLARHAVAGQDIVLVGRAGTATRSFAALREEFETALKRLKVWTESRGAAS
jgi:ribonuclease P protein component